MNICQNNLCTGCTACAAVCPTDSIVMQEDNCGFLHPFIEEGKCIGCHKCIRVCPNNALIKKSNDGKSYIGKIKDNGVIKQSASGGIGYILSKYIVENGGVVFGAAYDENHSVRHILVEGVESLSKLQGSKYVQSDVSGTYRQAIAKLKQGKMVAYFGTPCQIAGLLSVVPKNLAEKLYTCDILCAGVPSPLSFRKYITNLDNNMNSRIVSINFKSKSLGYSFGYLTEVELDNKKKKLLCGKDSTYVKSIGYGYVRESCHECKYKDIDRVSDISLGDYAKEAINNELGISSILVNTEKGKELIEFVSESIEIYPIAKQQIVSSQKGAFCHLFKKPNEYEEFFAHLKTKGWDFVSDRYLISKSLVEALKNTIPPQLISIFRRFVR